MYIYIFKYVNMYPHQPTSKMECHSGFQPRHSSFFSESKNRTVAHSSSKAACGCKFDQDPSERQGFLEAHGAPHRWIVGGGHIIRQWKKPINCFWWDHWEGMEKGWMWWREGASFGGSSCRWVLFMLFAKCFCSQNSLHCCTSREN